MNEHQPPTFTEPVPEIPSPYGSHNGGPKTPAGKAQSAKNSLKHGLTAVRAWSGAEWEHLNTQALQLADHLGSTAAADVYRITNLLFARDRDQWVAETESLLLTRQPAGIDLANVHLASLQDDVSLSTLRTLKRLTVRQGRVVTKLYDQVLGLTPAEACASSNPVSPAEEFSKLAVLLNIPDPERNGFYTQAEFWWSIHPPANGLALQLTLDLILDECRLMRLQAFGLQLLDQLSVSTSGEPLGHCFGLLQDVQGFNALEVLSDLEAALRKRIEVRVKQLARANNGPWPALVIAEPVTATAADTNKSQPV